MASETASPQKIPPQSPWKKPRVSLLKTKSIKRKSDIFNLNGSTNVSSLSNNNSLIQNENSDEQTPKTRKTIFNRCSISNNSNFSFGFNKSPSNTINNISSNEV